MVVTQNGLVGALAQLRVEKEHRHVHARARTRLHKTVAMTVMEKAVSHRIVTPKIVRVSTICIHCPSKLT
jgi:hypothetical protein